jgi:hypothetical protein
MEAQVEAYVRDNYKKLFGDKTLIITEFESFFTVKSNIDQSPLILSKSII